MNQPNGDDRLDKIEQRLDKIEEDRDSIVESEKLLLKMARLHRIGLQELRGSLEVDIADLRERTDHIEHKLNDLGNVADRIEEHQYKQDDRLGRIEELLVQLVLRLPQPDGE